MCIIASKPAGIKMPSDSTIENMWFRNHDGAGFMYAADGNVHIEKGFMKLEDFKQALAKVAASHDMTATPLVMHFRIATHGSVIPANTHPFPVTTSVGVLQKLVCNTKLGVAHNGIIQGVTPRKGISDTMEFIASQLGLLYKANPEFYKNSYLMEMITNAVNSKLSFLTSDGQIYTVGHFEEEDGILYSNTTYKPYDDFKLGTWDNVNHKWLYSAYGSYDNYYDDCPFGEPSYGYVDTILVRMVGEHEGEFVINDKGVRLFPDDYDMVVDTDGFVYKYSNNYEGIVLMDEWLAYSADGRPLRAMLDNEPKDGYTFYEDVVEEVVEKPKQVRKKTSRKKKKSRS